MFWINNVIVSHNICDAIVSVEFLMKILNEGRDDVTCSDNTNM